MSLHRKEEKYLCLCTSLTILSTVMEPNTLKKKTAGEKARLYSEYFSPNPHKNRNITVEICLSFHWHRRPSSKERNLNNLNTFHAVNHILNSNTAAYAGN